MQNRGLLMAAVILAAATVASAQTAVFQYSVTNDTTRKKKDSEEFEKVTSVLWLPAEAKQVRGLVVSGQTLIERQMSKGMREQLREQGIGVLHFRGGLGSVNLQKTLDDYAALSGYKELSVVPMFFVGHSAGGPQARGLAAEMPERTFGLMQFRGGAPWAGGPIKDITTQPATQPRDRYVPGYVPSLMMVGQFDEFGGTRREDGWEPAWMGVAKALGEQRAAQPAALWSMVVEPGAGHFAWSERNEQYLGMFIKKAAALRIPAEFAADKVPELKKIDAASGWLADVRLKQPLGNGTPAAPAPVAKFAGDKEMTSWLFDEEMAKAFVAFHDGIDRKDQFIKWNDPYTIEASVRFFFTKQTWVDDGLTLQVNPGYWDIVPKETKDGKPKWPNEGQAAGNSGAPLKVKNINGPFTVVANDKMRLTYDQLSPAGEGGRATFVAYSEGNKEYRYAEQVGMLPKNFGPNKNPKAADNVITFEPIGNLNAGSGPVVLKATASSGKPVEFYVAVGPARVVDGKLTLAEVPARGSFPMKIKVVAWQGGSYAEPQVKAATPVEQEILLEK